MHNLHEPLLEVTKAVKNKQTNKKIKNGQKIWTDTSPKKIYIWQISIWKDAQHHMLLGNYKLKQPWDTATWLKSRTWQHQMLTEMWCNRNSHSLLVGIQNSTATLEDSLTLSYKAKTLSYMWSNNCAPRYLGIENLCPHKNLHMGVYGSFIHNCQKLEAIKMSFNRGMDRQTVVHRYNGILFSNKKEWATEPKLKDKW